MSKKKKPTEEQNETVSFIEDPFALKKLDIQNMQDDENALLELEEWENEIELDDTSPLELNSTEETDERLKKLSDRMEKQEQEKVEELEALIQSDQENRESDLEEQIAEDLLLEQQIAEENKKLEASKETDPDVLNALPQPDENGELDIDELSSCIESLIFISEKPLSARKLKELLAPEYDTKKFKEALVNLQEKYNEVYHGMELVEVNHGFQFRTKAVRAPLAKKLAKVQAHRLSRGAMESLAIIAYKQPVLKDDIDKIRGVDSSHFIRTLLDKKLIHMAGRSELPGRPIVYETTSDFLEIFGLKDLGALPPLSEIEQMVPASSSQNNEDPRVKKMRALVEAMNTESDAIAIRSEEDDLFLDEIRERVKGVNITTPTLEKQDKGEPDEPETPPETLL